MKFSYRCRDAGAYACGARFKARDEDDLTAKLTEHLRKHGVAEPDETVLDHLRAVAKEEAEPSHPGAA